MNARSRLRSVLWIMLTFAGVLCCTRLENGNDVFGVMSSGGSAAGMAGAPQAGSVSQAGGGMSTSASGAAGAPDGGADCVDENGFDGVGCTRCPGDDVVSLENACTDSMCVPFDAALRLPRVVAGKLPDLPLLAVGGGAGVGGAAGGGSAGAAGSAHGGMGGASGSGGASDAGSGGLATAGSAGSGGSSSGGNGFDCSALVKDGTVVYVTGSTAAKPFLQQIAQQLAIQKVFVVYTSVGSCTGVDAIVHGTLMRTGAAPLAASATYWESSASNGKACDLPAEGVTADLGISDVFAPSCPGFELANLEDLKIRDAHGPIQTMTFAVPANSAYREISQQAAYMVFGFGRDGGVMDPSGQQPIWSDEKALLQRSASSGTQVMLAAAIGVPPGQWRGAANKSSDDVAAALQAATKTEEAASATLGIIGADYIDSRNLRAQIRPLAYQDSHQACAVTPDSNDTAKDKRNVRDGHYPIWGPLHLLYKVTAKGEPANSAIRQQLVDMVGYLSGSKALPNGVNLIDVYAQSGLVPECAMHVSRTADGGAITRARPENPCSCLFEKKATGATDCSSCKVQGDCEAGRTCSQGYCEP